MQHVELKNTSLRRLAEKACRPGVVALLLCLTGCSSAPIKPTGTPAAPPSQGPTTYFAPFVANTTNGGSLFPGANSYLIDDTSDAFSQASFMLPFGPQVINAGMFAASQRGLLSLQLLANYAPGGGNGSSYTATTYPSNPPHAGGFAVELASQAGGLMQIAGQPAAPLVAAAQCPTLKTAQTYQFITIPGAGVPSETTGTSFPVWNPQHDTAYGSVDITSDGLNFTFSNIQQHILPSFGGTGVPAQQAASPATGLCGPTVLGDTISVPGTLVITKPGIDPTTIPQAAIGIGPTGLLVEDNGFISTTGPSVGEYENLLGAGTGAVGLPKPSAPLSMTDLINGAQYLGFASGAGTYSSNSTPALGWSSHLVSFGGFSSTSSSCPKVSANTGTSIYGGDFTNDIPSAYSNGFGNCDLVIDLGTQTDNGLFSNAKVYFGSQYGAPNSTNAVYPSLPVSAVAIAGQLNGKYAIFLIGADSTQPWSIYLLQSN